MAKLFEHSGLSSVVVRNPACINPIDKIIEETTQVNVQKMKSLLPTILQLKLQS